MRASRISVEISAAVIALLAFFATFWQAWIARDAEKRSLRAYVSSDEPVVQGTPDPAGTIVSWEIVPKWANHGSTPTRNAIVTLQCLSISAEGNISAEATKAAPRPRNISPAHPIAPGSCVLTAAQLAVSIKGGIRQGARSTVDYLDVFGEHHHSEQCFTVEFLGDPARNADPLRATVQCERNCEDEECKSIIPSAPPHKPPRWASLSSAAVKPSTLGARDAALTPPSRVVAAVGG